MQESDVAFLLSFVVSFDHEMRYDDRQYLSPRFKCKMQSGVLSCLLNKCTAESKQNRYTGRFQHTPRHKVIF